MIASESQTKYLFGHMFAKRTLNPDIVPTPRYLLYRRSKAFTVDLSKYFSE